MTAPTTFDPRPALHAAIDQTGRIITGLAPADLDRATPCPDWTVRDLAGHCSAVLARISHLLPGGDPAELPTTLSLPDGELAVRWAQERDRLFAVLTDDELLGRIVIHPAGRMPAPAALGAYVNELAVHAWDLNRALGDPVVLDEELAGGALAAARDFLPADLRGGPVPFAPPVAVADDAPVADQLAGWMGRDPAWSAAGE